MKWLTIDQIIAALRLDAEQAELERCLLELYGRSAERSILNIVRRSYAELIDTYGDVPDDIMVATFELADNLIRHRSPGEQVGISTATISRVSKCLNYGAGGYRAAIDRLKEEETK